MNDLRAGRLKPTRLNYLNDDQQLLVIFWAPAVFSHWNPTVLPAESTRTKPLRVLWGVSVYPPGTNVDN